MSLIYNSKSVGTPYPVQSLPPYGDVYGTMSGPASPYAMDYRTASGMPYGRPPQFAMEYQSLYQAPGGAARPVAMEYQSLHGVPRVGSSQFAANYQRSHSPSLGQLRPAQASQWAYSTDSASARGTAYTPANGHRPLRVIHVSQCLVRAGIEYWLMGLMRYSDPQRLRFVRCVVASDQLDTDVARELGVPVEMGGADSVRRAAKDCDVLLVSGPAEVGNWLNGVRPKACVFVAHGDGEWTRRVLDGCAPVIDHVVAVSRRVQQLSCTGISSTVILNGVDAAHVSRSRPRTVVRESLGFSDSDFVLGFAGRYSIEKRPELLIEAVAQLPRRFKALLVGWGPMRYDLMDYANALIPGRYAFVTATEHIGDYYEAMDAFCLTSEFEGFGLVGLEAMLCNRPVIARAVGFVPEVIQDRVNGLVVEGDPASFARAAELLDRHATWARSVAAEGQAYAEREGHAIRMCREYEDLFERLCLTNGNDKNGSLHAARAGLA